MAQISRRRLLSTGSAAEARRRSAHCCPVAARGHHRHSGPAGGLSAIEHVIVLMQENRSFDHYFGSLRGVRGFGNHDPLRHPDGRSVFRQPRTSAADLGDHVPNSPALRWIQPGRRLVQRQHLRIMHQTGGDPEEPALPT